MMTPKPANDEASEYEVYTIKYTQAEALPPDKLKPCSCGEAQRAWAATPFRWPSRLPNDGLLAR